MRQLPLYATVQAFLGSTSDDEQTGDALTLEGESAGGGWFLLEDGDALILEDGGLILLEVMSLPGGGFLVLEDGGLILLQGPPGPVVNIGGGTASVGPESPGEAWTGLTASVSVSTNKLEAVCSIYAGAGATPRYLADVTTWGSTGASTTNLPVVKVGGSVWAIWTGGDPGARATLTVTGTKTVR